MGIKAFNHLPSHIKRLPDDKNHFKKYFEKLSLIKLFLLTE
jgi:hypothetical protein